MAGKQVAKSESPNVPATAFDYGDMAGTGFEDTKGSDLSIPFLNLLQSNSPEVEDQKVEGAQAGMIYNTVTSQLLTEVVFLPVHYEEAWVEWVPRTKGGGFVGMHAPDSDVVKEAIKANGGSRIPPKGGDGKRIPFKVGENELVETYYMYGLILNEDGSQADSFGVISFSSTKIKPYRDWLTSMFIIRGKPPIFANRVKVNTLKQKNDSGSFFNFNVLPLRTSWVDSLIDPGSEKYLLDEAVSFREMVLNGVARADYQQQQNAATGGDGDGEGDETPF